MISLTLRNISYARYDIHLRSVTYGTHDETSLQSLLRAISRVRFDNGKTPPVVRQFLIDQLRYNDNTANPVCSHFLFSLFTPHLTPFQYSDAFYICATISALACATVSTVPPERGEFTAQSDPMQDVQDGDLLKQALAEVDRYRSMDRLIPSYHNVVTVAVIEVNELILVMI